MGIVLLLLIPIFATILLLVFGRKKYISEKISVISAIFEVIVGGYLVAQVVSAHTYDFSIYFHVFALNSLFLLITIVVGLIVTLHSVGYLQEEFKKKMLDDKNMQLAYVLMRLFLLFIYIALLTTSPILMWIAIEATTLVTVFMINLFNRKTDLEAAWKFLIINSIGLLLGLFGTFIFLTQGSHGTQIILRWSDVMDMSKLINPESLKFAFILVFIGYGTKLGLVPMHTWKPDTYNKAPLPIVAMLSTVLLNTAYLAILQFTMIVNNVIGTEFTSQLFIFFGILTLFLSASIIFTQKNLKRLLAYSTIEHAGIIALGFGFGGIGVFGAILHMVYHSFAKMSLFLLASNIVVRYSSSVVANIAGMITVLPITSIYYVIAFLFIVGMPPFGMFFSEFYIFFSGFSQNIALTVFALFMLVLVFVGFLKTTMNMLFAPVPEGIVQGEKNKWMLLPVGALTAALIIMSVYLPDFVVQLMHESVNIITLKTP